MAGNRKDGRGRGRTAGPRATLAATAAAALVTAGTAAVSAQSAPAPNDLYLRTGAVLDHPARARFADRNCASESPAALYQRQRGSAERLRLVERFTRVGPDTLRHEFTIDDPGTYAGQWTAMIPLSRKDEALYEYACHEGNIGMEGILAGHRAEEREAAAAAGGAR